jgi:hypothetical protein
VLLKFQQRTPRPAHAASHRRTGANIRKGHTNGIQDLMCCILVPPDINCAEVIGDDSGSDGLVEVRAAKLIS